MYVYKGCLVYCVNLHPWQIISAEYTFGPQALGNPYHVTIIRTRVTRNLSILLPVMKDEMIAALNELFDMKPNGCSASWKHSIHTDDPLTEWKSVPVVDSCHSIISRMMNRAIVGVPLCTSSKILLALTILPSRS